jgi:hypothetical protein
MIDLDPVPVVEENELLARYVTQRGQFRTSDFTVKQDLFIPHPHQELSATRHLQATEAELWIAGRDVVEAMGKTLYGRSDIKARDCTMGGIEVIADPLPNNPNHANLTGWPNQKQEQKAIALQLAASASPLIPPPSEFHAEK